MARSTTHARTAIRGTFLGAAVPVLALALATGTVAPASAQDDRTGDAAHQGQQDDHGHGRSAVYAALGDSYTSGPGIPDQVDARCARSDRNYPSLVARDHDITAFTDVSCGGATTAEMWQAQGTNKPQLDALTRHTTLVTLQIGGNDVGFGPIIVTCAGLSVTDPAGNPCQRHYEATGTDQLAENVLRTAPKVAAVLTAVHQRAPQARVVVVGYPDLLPDSGIGCFPAVPFAAGDFAYLRDTEKRLNTMLRQEARAAHAEYVDTYGPTIGHDMCQTPADRWIEPLVPASPAAPAHPNAKGEQAMAGAVLERLDGHGRRPSAD